MPTPFLRDKHIKYIQSLNKKQDELEYWLTEHLRLNGIYWSVTALDLMGALDVLPRTEMINFVLSCQDDETGGFGAHPGHDPHILSTLSAVQILLIEGALDLVDADKIANYICSLQDVQTGEIKGDKWGEIDTRFIYVAFQCLEILGKLNLLQVEKSVDWIMKCQNYDGGFGMVPGAESHSAQIFTCLGALSISGYLNEKIPESKLNLLAWWLCERQLTENGGLNGRPEKLADACYSWWVVASLAMLGRKDWIDELKLKEFVLSCQDIEDGGIADRPGNQVDVYHTLFGMAGLSLFNMENLAKLDPIRCLPVRVLDDFIKD